jgi:hypothetical protein
LFDHPNELKSFYPIAWQISHRNVAYDPQPFVLKQETPEGIVLGSECDLVHYFTVCNDKDCYFVLEIVDNFNHIIVICKH